MLQSSSTKVNVINNLRYLFSSRKRVKKFFWSFLIGAPAFFVIGILVTLAPEFAKQQGLENVEASIAIVYCYGAVAASDFTGTLLSKYFKTRKRIIFTYLVIQLVAITIYLFLPVPTATLFYCKIALLGVSIGFWGLIILFASENWGTNLRGTVTTAVPNLIRALLIPVSILLLDPLKKEFSLVTASIIVSLILLSVAFYSLSRFRDTFENDLNFSE
jgi:MFS transporter, putative metabolite:H+ symporter